MFILRSAGSGDQSSTAQPGYAYDGRHRLPPHHSGRFRVISKADRQETVRAYDSSPRANLIHSWSATGLYSDTDKDGNRLDQVSLRDAGNSMSQRFGASFLNHYVGLHTTVVSVAIAVAGVAAASLGTSQIYHENHRLLWLLWLISILCCAIVYMGVLSSIIVIPAGIPSAFDLLIPVFLGVSEFLMFGVLAHQATGLTRTSSVVHAWFLSFAVFCLCSVAGILRADQISAKGPLASYPRKIEALHRKLSRDVSSASIMGIVGVLGSLVTVNGRISPLSYVIASILLAGLSLGLTGHARTARLVEKIVRSQAANPPHK